MTQYITSKAKQTPTPTALQTPTKQPPHNFAPGFNVPGDGNDEDSMSILGNNTARKWANSHNPSPSQPSVTIPQSISQSKQTAPHSDDRSTGSVSTLHTRLTSIEGQYQELSGTMEQIKHMLNLIANPRTTQDGDPRSLDSAGQGSLAGESL